MVNLNWGIITFKIQIEIKKIEWDISYDLGWTTNDIESISVIQKQCEINKKNIFLKREIIT